MIASCPVMPNQRAKDKGQVSAWIPLAQYLALRAAAAILGCAVSDIIARLVERYAPDEIEEMKREQSQLRNVADTKGSNHANLC